MSSPPTVRNDAVNLTHKRKETKLTLDRRRLCPIPFLIKEIQIHSQRQSLDPDKNTRGRSLAPLVGRARA